MGSVSKAPKIKSVNIFLGFFFLVNFCVGTGFLGVPYGFFYSGYLAAVPTLTLIAAIAWINANYLLEVMARAQVSGRKGERGEREGGRMGEGREGGSNLTKNTVYTGWQFSLH